MYLHLNMSENDFVIQATVFWTFGNSILCLKLWSTFTTLYPLNMIYMYKYISNLWYDDECHK